MRDDEIRAARILIADDQSLNVRLLEQILARAGFADVVSTTDPRQVVPLVAATSPDLIALDLHMPDLDGFGVMELLRGRIAAEGYLPIIVLTADVTDETKRRALAAGARDFLTKPIDAIEVVLRIRNLLETRFLYRALRANRDDLENQVRARTRDLEMAQVETLERLARTAEFRDDDTGAHVIRVGRVSALLGRAMGLGSSQVDLLRLAAPLHDLGKVAIRDAILMKPGRLTPGEFEEMKGHALIGARILAGSRSPLLQLAEEVALTHHERWDGTGYLELEGEAIPPAARIVSVADVFDALTHARPYKEAWPVERAAAEIIECAGAQFDPAVVEAFTTLDPSALVDPAEPEGLGRTALLGVVAAGSESTGPGVGPDERLIA